MPWRPATTSPGARRVGVVGLEGHFDGADPWYRYDEALAPARAIWSEPRPARWRSWARSRKPPPSVRVVLPAEGRRTKILIEQRRFLRSLRGGRATAIGTGWTRTKTSSSLGRCGGLYDNRTVLATSYRRAATRSRSLVGCSHILDGRSARSVGVLSRRATARDVSWASISRTRRETSSCSSTAGTSTSLRVHLQVPQWRPWGGRRSFRSRASGSDPRRPRLAGWWGNDPATRFEMASDFVPSRAPRMEDVEPTDPVAGAAEGIAVPVRRAGVQRLRNEVARAL